MDLDKLFEKWKDGRLRYPQLRRQAEDEFFGGLVAKLKELEAAKTDIAGVIGERLDAVEAAVISRGAAADRMAEARAAKAAKRMPVDASADMPGAA